MADTGILQHDARLGGGALRLYEEDGETKLVLAGPRDGLPEQGVVAVYGHGRLLAKLYVTAAGEGRLSLRLDNGAGAPTETVVLEAGSDDSDGQPRRRARLLLTEDEEGRPENKGRIELGFGDNGPYLKLIKGLNVVKLSVDGGLEVPQFRQLFVVEPAPEF